MVIKLNKAWKNSKDETKKYTEEPTKSEKERDTEMMLLLYTATLVGQM